VDGVTRGLPRPFLVLATQNPVEYEGTFPLPEAQLDRFLLRLRLGYPTLEDERQVLTNLRRAHPIDSLGQVADAERLVAAQAEVCEVHVEDAVRDYILAVVRKTREHPDVALGASPRGSLALYRASQAYAALRGRDFVTPDEPKHLAPYALAHRLIVRPESQLRGKSAESVLGAILDSTEIPLGRQARVV
jgi:MoxR-like ATPase